MNIVERCIEIIAPHPCLACGREGSLLCEQCALSQLSSVPSRCYRCYAATKQSQVCRNCKRTTYLSHVWVISEYEATAKELVHKLKFERASAAASTIASLLDYHLPLLPQNVIVAHIPTANSRVRQRGYDQAQLIAKTLAGRRNWRSATLLVRHGAFRQVGASRKQRFKQLEEAFEAGNIQTIKQSHILLIDDVLTTGATVEAAATILKSAGAKTIDVAVFAQGLKPF
jgi:ComF family protein